MIIEGGEEMVKSVWLLFKEILSKMEIPNQWEEVRVKSIYKNKGKKSEMKNRRGIFLTSVLGKLLEKVILEVIKDKLTINKHQNGGKKERSTKDN